VAVQLSQARKWIAVINTKRLGYMGERNLMLYISPGGLTSVGFGRNAMGGCCIAPVLPKILRNWAELSDLGAELCCILGAVDAWGMPL
jgi:hypothetical protein